MKNSTTLKTGLLVAALAAAISAQANTLYVATNGYDGNPGAADRPYQTIGRAIAVARSGDTILVGPGTYSGTANIGLEFGGKNLVLRSTEGAARTIIDGTGQRLVALAFQYDYTPATVVDGFTIQNVVNDGSGGSQMGAMTIEAGSPTIRNVVFRSCQNSTSWGGAAVLIKAGSPLLWGCRFEGNSARTGGALTNTSPGTVQISHCTFQGNSATEGAVDTGGSGGGGAIFTAQGGRLQIDGCAFRENRATTWGGAIKVNSTTSITASTFQDNSAGKYGGAVYVAALAEATRVAVADSAFVRNACRMGGALYDTQGIDLVRCTFADNKASFQGGAIWTAYTAFGPRKGQTNILGCILYGNSQEGGNYVSSTNPQGKQGPGPNQIFSSRPTVVANCDVEGGWGGTGNFDADPMFVRNPEEPLYPYGDLHLQPGSPCLDRGGHLDGEQYATDLDGLARVANDIPDLGAYEMQPTSWFQGDPKVHYVLYNAATRRALQFNGFGIGITQASPDGSARQQWDVVPVSGTPGAFRIVSRENGAYNLDVFWARKDDGAAVGSSTWNGGLNQQWALSCLGNQTYKVASLNTGKLLEVLNEDPVDYEIVSSSPVVDQRGDMGRSRYQEWILAPVRG